VCAATNVRAQDDSGLRFAVLVPEQVMVLVFREAAARWPSRGQRTAVRSPAVISPRKIKDVPPVYPTAARVAGVSGTVIVQIVLDETGKVGGATIVRSIPLLDQAAIDCVKQWQFTPALANGSPIPSTMVVTVTFGPQR
jgi:protein TonB